LTEQDRRPRGVTRATRAGATSPRSADRGDDAPVVLDLDPRLRGRFAEIADGRILVVDFLLTRQAPHLAAGELAARWERKRPVGFVDAAPIEGVACMHDPRLAWVLRECGPRLCPVAGAVLGQLWIDLARPLAWLDFLASPAARQPLRTR
jgi:hypothetical protein